MSGLSDSVLPDDLVTKILSRLPIKPIARFKCVSKPWLSLFLNPKFLKTHLELHIDDPGYFILTRSQSNGGPHILTLPTTAAAAAAGSSTATNDVVLKKVRSEIEIESPVVLGSCNGLLLLDNFQDKLLINPITSETTVLDVTLNPTLNPALNPTNIPDIPANVFYGFGYDTSNDDYKIVTLSTYDQHDHIFVDVYSLKTKCWKRIDKHVPGIDSIVTDMKHPSSGVFLNGRLHWFGCSSNYAIACFDLVSEEFVEGLFPANNEQMLLFNIIVLKGRLALVTESFQKMSYSVWVMREYGVPDSWTQITTTISICPEVENYYRLVGDLNKDEIVLQKYCMQLVVYNPRNGVFRDLVVSGLCRDHGVLMPFRASLLSPRF